MGQYVLVVTGADSRGFNPGESISHRHTYDNFSDARDNALTWEGIWKEFGFTLAPSGLYTKGSIWRRCVLIDDQGMEWYLAGVGHANLPREQS